MQQGLTETALTTLWVVSIWTCAARTSESAHAH